jgi:hypothetical protein
MYTLVVTLILISLNIYIHAASQYRYLILFTIVNAVGLYIDYAFFWYFGPLIIFFGIKMLKHFHRESFFMFASTLISAALFLICFPYALTYYSQGVAGIQWMIPYTSPTFYIPFFFGTHTFYLGLLFLGVLFLFGIYILWKQYQKNAQLHLLTFTTYVSLVGTLLYSLSGQVIFHVRSLQIVALFILIVSAIALQQLYSIRKYVALACLLLVIIVNCYAAVTIIMYQPGRVLISPFPWKNTVETLENTNTTFVVYRQTKKLPTPLLIWGLKYSLDGNETLGNKPILSLDISHMSYSLAHCKLFSDSLLDIYTCKQ